MGGDRGGQAVRLNEVYARVGQVRCCERSSADGGDVRSLLQIS